MLMAKASLFALLLVFSWKTGNQASIIVEGKAMDAKAGACLVTKENMRYYIDGLASWDKKYLGKTIRVMGTLFIEQPGKADSTGVLVQEISGIKRTIKKPKFSLLK